MAALNFTTTKELFTFDPRSIGSCTLWLDGADSRTIASTTPSFSSFTSYVTTSSQAVTPGNIASLTSITGGTCVIGGAQVGGGGAGNGTAAGLLAPSATAGDWYAYCVDAGFTKLVKIRFVLSGSTLTVVALSAGYTNTTAIYITTTNSGATNDTYYASYNSQSIATSQTSTGYGVASFTINYTPISSVVTQWNDKSGNGNNATASGTACPLSIPSGIGSLNAMSFNGYGQSFNTQDLYTNRSFVIVIVAKRQTAIASAMLGGGTAGGANQSLHLTFNSTNLLRFGFYSNDLDYSSFPSYSGNTATEPAYLLMFYYVPGRRQIYVNGVLVASDTNSSNVANGTSMTIGRFFGNIFTGLIGEFMVFNTALTTAQRQALEGYLAWKWGLRTNIPVTHPYRYILPYSRAFTPVNIDGCQLWYDGNDPNGTGVTPSNGAIISTWVDKSGNGRNATATGSPAYATNVQNGLGTMLLRGSAPISTFATPSFIPSTNGDASVFVVVKQSAYVGTLPQNSDFLIADSYQYFVMYGMSNTTNPIFTMYASPGFYLGTMSNTTLYSAIGLTNYVATGYSNGTTVNSATGNGSWPLTGNRTFYLGNGPGFQGYIYELLMYGRALNTSERQQVEGYLANKWGLRSLQTTTNPFRSALLPAIPAFLPTQISGLNVWYDGSDPNGNGNIPANGTSISTWVNKISSNTNATSATPPVFSASSLNNLGTVRFNGATTIAFLDIPAFDFGTSQRTVFLVMQNTGPSSGAASSPTWFWPLTGNGTNSLSFDIWIRANVQGAAYGPSTVLNKNQYYVITYRFGSTSAFEEIFTNGSLAATNTKTNGGSSYANATSGYRLGWLPGDSGTTSRLDGNIGEVLLFNTALTTNQRQAVEGYLAWKWGLQGKLPTTHPYYRVKI